MNRLKHQWRINLPILALCCALLSAMLVSWSFDLEAKTNQQTQTRYRAAFIYKMAKYVNWSIPKQAPLTFCFFATPQAHNISSVLTELKASGKLKVQGHEVNIKTMEEDKVSSIEHYYHCSLIYFDDKTDPKLSPDMLTQLSKTKLTIGNGTDFMTNGGLSALILRKGKLKLYVNRASYERTTVRIRSRLLSLVRFHPQ